MAQRSDFGRGIIKGSPLRYISGHACIKRNRIEKDDQGCIRIFLKEDLYTIIDTDALDSIQHHGWFAVSDRRTQYAHAVFNHDDGTRQIVRLHRLLTNASVGEIVDHRNGNGLDNRRANLRIATSKENGRNQRLPQTNTTGYKGVIYHDQPNKKWSSIIRTDEGREFLGYFSSAEEAARAYDDAAREFHGEFATLNFPDIGERKA